MRITRSAKLRRTKGDLRPIAIGKHSLEDKQGDNGLADGQDPDVESRVAEFKKLLSLLNWTIDEYVKECGISQSTAARDFKNTDPFRLKYLQLRWAMDRGTVPALCREDAFNEMWTEPNNGRLRRAVVAARIPLLQSQVQYARKTAETIARVNCDLVLVVRQGGDAYASVSDFFNHILASGLADEKPQGRIHLVLLDRDSTRNIPEAERLFFGTHDLATYCEYHDEIYKGRYLIEVAEDGNRGDCERLVEINPRKAERVISGLWQYFRKSSEGPFLGRPTETETFSELIRATKPIRLDHNWTSDPISLKDASEG